MPGGKARADTVEVVVEMPADRCNRYEYGEGTGHFRLDRVVYSFIHYPTEYGIIPDTRDPDGEPLDALVVIPVPRGIAP